MIDVDAAQESRGPVQCAPYSGYVEQGGQLIKLKRPNHWTMVTGNSETCVARRSIRDAARRCVRHVGDARYDVRTRHIYLSGSPAAARSLSFVRAAPPSDQIEPALHSPWRLGPWPVATLAGWVTSTDLISAEDEKKVGVCMSACASWRG